MERKHPNKAPDFFLTQDSILHHLRVGGDANANPGPSNQSSEPVMKKARYVWQIKGQHPLKSNSELQLNNEDEEEKRLYKIVLNRWQDKQLTRAYFDNTINKMLEKTGLIGPEDNMEDLIEDYVNPLARSEWIVDEAVGMAILSHGLQPPCACPDLPPGNPPRVPFHRRFGGPSTSWTPINNLTKEPEEDVVSQAINVAIQKKGLGALVQSDANR